MDFINICCFEYSRFFTQGIPKLPINITIFRMLCYCLATTIISMMKWNKNHGSLSKQQAGLMRDFDANASTAAKHEKKWTMIITTWFQASVNHFKLAYLEHTERSIITFVLPRYAAPSVG